MEKKNLARGVMGRIIGLIGVTTWQTTTPDQVRGRLSAMHERLVKRTINGGPPTEDSAVRNPTLMARIGCREGIPDSAGAGNLQSLADEDVRHAQVS